MSELTEKQKLIADIASILTSLLECGNVGTPEGMIYTSLGMDYERYQKVRVTCLQCNWLDISGNWVKLTSEGITIAQKCNDALAKK